MKIEEALCERLSSSLPELATMRVESVLVTDSTHFNPVLISDTPPDELDKDKFDKDQMQLISSIMGTLLTELEVTVAISTNFLQRHGFSVVLEIKHPMKEQEVVHLDYEDTTSTRLHVADSGILATLPVAVKAPDLYKLPRPEKAWDDIDTIHRWVVSTLRLARQKCLDSNTYHPSNTKAESETLNKVLRTISKTEALDLFRLISRMTFEEIETLLNKSSYSRRF